MVRSQKPNRLGLIAVLGLSAAAVIYFLPDEAAAKTIKPVKPKPQAEGKFRKEDLVAHFDPLDKASANVFHPLLASGKKLGLEAKAKDATSIPTEAAGEAGWEYKNFSQIDGRNVAMLENSANGKSAVVGAGEKWKLATFAEVTPEKLVLAFGKDQKATVSRFTEPKEPEGDAKTLGPEKTVGVERRGLPTGGPSVQNVIRG